MNIESMRIRSYRSFKVDEHVPAVAAERYRTLKAYDRLRSAGCSEGGALGQLGISRHAVSVAGRLAAATSAPWRRSRRVRTGSGTGRGRRTTSRR